MTERRTKQADPKRRARPAAEFDLVVFGATSFVGRILCSYLASRTGAGRVGSWAIAGRSADKLQALRDSLGAAGAKLPMIVADASDASALRDLCARTRVVISTVGPYALYGEPLVQVCAASGTDYCDLTGEVQWVARMLERHEAAARESGARIVHCCGFDSIPSDLGVLFLQQQAIERFGQPCVQVGMRVKAMRGGASGGTIASMLNIVEEAARDPALRRSLANPYWLCPPGTGAGVRQISLKGPAWDADFDSWTAPFVMAVINTRVVLRSNALAGHPYGAGFRYDEALLTGRGLPGRLAALGVTAGMGGFALGAALAPTRAVMQRFVLPGPGTGPSPQAQRKGFFDLRFLGRTADGRTLRTRVTGDRDPGYGSTGKMLGEAGACLAMDVGKADLAGGFWTPATSMGQLLLARLQAHAGIRFEVLAG